ncbi:glycosyltransferase [Hutsoniella sourekii]
MFQYRKQPAMRILHIMSGYGGGISTFIHNIASEIQSYGIQFDVVTYDRVSDEFLQAIQSTGGDVYQLKNPKKAGWFEFRKSFTRILELYDYDLIHCHISGYRSLVYKYLASQYQIRKIFVHAHYIADHESTAPLKQVKLWLDQWANNYVSDAFIGCSREAIRSLYGFKTPVSQMIIIPNSINEAAFVKDEYSEELLRKEGRQQFALESYQPVIGHIGRLHPIKNHQLSLAIARYMKRNQLPGVILFVGAGELAEELEQTIKEEDLHDQVRLVGRVSPISDFLPVLDAIILPSFKEGLGTVAIEGQAAGIPIVMNETITRESDLDLDLINRLSLEASPAEWYEALVEASRKEKPSADNRLEALNRHKFTNNQAARLYTRFIRGEVR